MRPLPFLVVALLLATPPLHAADAGTPQRKPGVWAVNSQSPEAPGLHQEVRVCVGPGADDLASTGDNDGGHCTRSEIRQTDHGFVLETTCRQDGHTITTHAVFSGDFSSHYRGTMDSRYDPPLQGIATTHTQLEARWLGPCAPGQQPGLVSVPGMPAGIDIQNMLKQLPRAPAH